MKICWILLIPSFLFAPIAFAQKQTREMLITQVETEFSQSSLIPADSPFAEALLRPAKLANPGVSEKTWASIKPEVVLAASSAMTEKGGLFDAVLHSALAPLSDDDLERLSVILADPAYRRFQAAMSRSATQKQFGKTLMENTLKMGAAINTVLVRHGLREVH